LKPKIHFLNALPMIFPPKVPSVSSPDIIHSSPQALPSPKNPKISCIQNALRVIY
jgi:hypothetical protein